MRVSKERDYWAKMIKYRDERILMIMRTTQEQPNIEREANKGERTKWYWII